MRRKRTPAECIGLVINAAMGAQGFTEDRLADAACVHKNTVHSDLKDPDRIPMKRVWLYFAALDIPVDEALAAFADSFAQSLITR